MSFENYVVWLRSMKKKPKEPCGHPGCDDSSSVKGLCKRHYQAEYWKVYYANNRIEILLHMKHHRVSKQSR
jgi:hypothetical protein